MSCGLRQEEEGPLTPLEHMLDIYGDTWVWIAFAPITKVVPAWVAGKRTRQESVRLIQRLQSSTDGHIPFFTSDELPHYAAAFWRCTVRLWCRHARAGRAAHEALTKFRRMICSTRW